MWSVRLQKNFISFVTQVNSTAPWWQLPELQARAFEEIAKTPY